MRITFRRLADTDLPMLHRWLNEAGVVRWWEGDDVSWEAVVRDYEPAPSDSTEHWIASLGGTDLGWLQCYPAADEPEETDRWFALGIDKDAAGIDYLIGEPGLRGRGIGSAMIRGFVADVVFGLHPDWSQACAAPFAGNEASWQALANAGFRFVGVIDDRGLDALDGGCRLMAIDRDKAAPPHPVP